MPCFSHKKSTRKNNDFYTTPAEETNVTALIQNNEKKEPCANLVNNLPYKWEPTQKTESIVDYIKRLEMQYAEMERNMFIMNANYARMHCRLRQIAQTYPCNCNDLLKALECIMLDSIRNTSEPYACDELPAFLEDVWALGDANDKQKNIISSIRSRFTDLFEASEALSQDPDLLKEQSHEMTQISEIGNVEETSIEVTDLRDIATLCKELTAQQGLSAQIQNTQSSTNAPTLCCGVRVKGFQDDGYRQGK